MSFVRTLPTLAEAQRAATEYAKHTQSVVTVNMPNGKRLVIDWDGEASEVPGWVPRRHQGAIFTTHNVEGKMR